MEQNKMVEELIKHGKLDKPILDIIPVFEVVTDNKHFKIYSNGMTEGFEGDGKCLVINRFGLVR